MRWAALCFHVVLKQESRDDIAKVIFLSALHSDSGFLEHPVFTTSIGNKLIFERVQGLSSLASSSRKQRSVPGFAVCSICCQFGLPIFQMTVFNWFYYQDLPVSRSVYFGLASCRECWDEEKLHVIRQHPPTPRVAKKTLDELFGFK